MRRKGATTHEPPRVVQVLRTFYSKKDWQLAMSTSVITLLLLLLWLGWGKGHTSVNSVQWVLSAIIQSMAIMLGLVMGAYVLMLDRAERSLDHLHRKQTATLGRLASVYPALTRGFADLQTNDVYWYETNRRLTLLWLALTELLPEEVTESMEEIEVGAGTDEITNSEDTDEVIRLVSYPDAFLSTLHSITNLAPLEPGYPQRSILGEFRREYGSDIARHVRTVQRSRWVCKGPGRALPVTLAFTFMTSALLLSVSNGSLPQAVTVWGVSLVLAFTAVSFTLFALVAGRMIQPVNSTSRHPQLHRIQLRLGKGRLSA